MQRLKEEIKNDTVINLLKSECTFSFSFKVCKFMLKIGHIIVRKSYITFCS